MPVFLPSLESLLDTCTPEGADENQGIQTLVTESMVPYATSTPTQQQLTRVQRHLMETTKKLITAEANYEQCKSDLVVANLQITLKDEEIMDLKNKLLILIESY